MGARVLFGSAGLFISILILLTTLALGGYVLQQFNTTSGGIIPASVGNIWNIVITFSTIVVLVIIVGLVIGTLIGVFRPF